MSIEETIGRIRREDFVKGKTINEIVHDLGISRNTVRKALRSEETSFAYERDNQPFPKLGPWSEKLDELRGERPDGTHAALRSHGRAEALRHEERL